MASPGPEPSPSGGSPVVPAWLDLPPARPVVLPGRGVVPVRVAPGPSADGPTIVLLHGLTATADLNWFAAYGPLAEIARVVAPDLRGHGGGIAADRFRLADAADDVDALLAELGIDRAVVVGYSMGGAVAQVLWQRHPSRVAGLVLCATATDYRERTWRGRLLEQPRRVAVAGLGRLLPGGARRWALARLRAASTRRLQADADQTSEVQRWAAGELARSDPFQVASAGAALRRYVAPDGLARIDVPVSVVVTTRDHVVPTADQRALVAALPEGTSVHEVDAGHGVFVEDPERFVPSLVSACADVVARGGWGPS